MGTEFKSVSGMASETEIIEFKQGNDKVVRKKPGRTTYSNIVLERGYTSTDTLFRWRKNIEDGLIDRRAGTLIIMDNDGETVISRYNFFEGWPCKWEVPSMDSDSSAMAIEKMEKASTQFAQRASNFKNPSIRTSQTKRKPARGVSPSPVP